MTRPEPAASPERPREVDLRVSVGTLHLQNPVIAASGTFGYGVELAHLVDLNRLGGIVVKGLSLEPMDGAPGPRLIPTAGGMMNAVGLQNIGVRAFITEKLPFLRQYRTALIANVFGHTIPQYVEVIRALEGAEGISAYELNISCPNVERGGAEFSADPSMVGAVVEATRKAASRPLWVKLPPMGGGILAIAKAAEQAGADALTIANTYPAMCVDIHTRRSCLGSTSGGLSGSAIKPITLRLVYEVSRSARIPVIGLGGVETPGDIVQYMLLGASAVQVGSAHFADPRASEKYVAGLDRLCKIEKINKISELRGKFISEED